MLFCRQKPFRGAVTHVAKGSSRHGSPTCITQPIARGPSTGRQIDWATDRMAERGRFESMVVRNRLMDLEFVPKSPYLYVLVA
jgi:hypothetical protein